MTPKQLLDAYTAEVSAQIIDEVVTNSASDYSMGINFGLMLATKIMNKVKEEMSEGESE